MDHIYMVVGTSKLNGRSVCLSRVLSCSSLVEALLCQGVVQAVVGVARSRVVSSSHSAAISTLQIFMLSEDSR